MTNNETVRFITGGTLDVVYRGEHSDLQFVAKAGPIIIHIIINGNFSKRIAIHATRSRGVNGVSAVSATNTNANYSAF
jgi:hypothetical protein